MTFVNLVEGFPVVSDDAPESLRKLKWEAISPADLRTCDGNGTPNHANVIKFFPELDRETVITALENLEQKKKKGGITAFYGTARGLRAVVLASNGQLVKAVVTDWDHDAAVRDSIQQEESAARLLSSALERAMASVEGEPGVVSFYHRSE